MMRENILEVKDLNTYFYTKDGTVRAVDGVSFSLPRGGTLGLVGESGCGKSVTAMSILRLIPDPPGKITRGEIYFEKRNLLALSVDELRQVRGKRIGTVFQEPMTSLNPVQTIGRQVQEPLLLHENISQAEAKDRVVEMLSRVGIPNAEKLFNSYPHQLSGGMRQRVMIAMALICRAPLLIADEPTTALDVTIQAQILELLQDLQDEMHMSILMITHNFGIIAEMVQDVAVMYAGKIIEHCPCREVFARPLHPYTQGLLASIPVLAGKRKNLYAIPGTVPDPMDFPPGCRFHPRCEKAMPVCVRKEPQLTQVDENHQVACWLYHKKD